MQKNKLKKFFCILLSIGIVLGVSGCAKEKVQKIAEPTTKIEKKEENHTEKTEEKEEYFDLDEVSEEDYSKYENGASITTEDPVPGKPSPVNPEDTTVDTTKEKTCYFSISCSTILSHKKELTEGKENLVPSNGMIYSRKKVVFYEGESVFDILQRETKNNGIHMEYSFTPGVNSNYVEGIGNIYEMDCGPNSGWMFSVNGWYPNYGCSRYKVEDQDEIQWNYTCDLGRDLK